MAHQKHGEVLSGGYHSIRNPRWPTKNSERYHIIKDHREPTRNMMYQNVFISNFLFGDSIPSTLNRIPTRGQ